MKNSAVPMKAPVVVLISSCVANSRLSLLARLVDRGGGAVNVAGPCQPDQPVPQVLPVDQDEGQHQHHDAELRQRVNQKAQDSSDRIEWPHLLNHFHGHWCWCCLGRCRSRARRPLQFLAQVLENAGRALQRSAAAGDGLEVLRLFAQA